MRYWSTGLCIALLMQAAALAVPELDKMKRTLREKQAGLAVAKAAPDDQQLKAAEAQVQLHTAYLKRVIALKKYLVTKERIEEAKVVALEAESAHQDLVKLRERMNALRAAAVTQPPARFAGPPLHSALRVGLLCYFSFNVEGETFEDDSGNGHLGAADNVQWVAKGKSGGAIALNGKGNVSVIDAKKLAFDRNFTLSAWFKLAQSPSKHSSAQVLIGKENVGTRSGYWFAFGGTADPGGALVMRLYHNDAQIENRWAEAAQLQPGRWYHAAGVFDKKSIKVFLDGRLQREVRWEFPSMPTLAPLRIGSSFVGELDEVMLHGRALPDREVMMLYKAKK